MKRVEGAVAIDILEPPATSALQRELDALSDEPMAADNLTFFRVPAHIRERYKLLYEPRMVAIGPYGSRVCNPSLRGMEGLKLRYLQSFRSRSGNRSIEDYVALIQELEPRARRCYFEPIELSTEKFAEKLLLDGCFIIEFLIKWNEGGNDGLFAVEWSLQLVRGDLLLLENQIPLFVLEKLFGLIMDSQIPSLMELLVNYLASISFECPKEEVEGNNNRVGEAKKFHHLLHLYYHCYVKKPQTARTGSSGKRSTIPSVTELLEAGVTIKKKKNQNQNQNSSFLDVTFSDGVLEIPFLSVENSTLPQFSNLVAFEQCGGCKLEEAYMTSYAVFMDCLIDTPGDVAILHRLGILENKLGSDEELVDFFNGLSLWVTLDYEKHYFAGLFRDVGEYCDSAWPKLRVTLVRDYIRSRWSFLSCCAAFYALLFTIIQTVFTVYPKK